MVEAFVVAKRPSGYNCIVGLDAMDQLEGAMIHGDRTVTFGMEKPAGVCVLTNEEYGRLKVGELDFEATFDPEALKWMMGWK